MDEVPDSSWFTNRIYARAVSIDEIVKGPNTIGWSRAGTLDRDPGEERRRGTGIHRSRREGRGLVPHLRRARDNPIAPTAAIAVATRCSGPSGYNQVETYLTSDPPENLVIGEEATIRAHGKRRPFMRRPTRRGAGALSEERGRFVPA